MYAKPRQENEEEKWARPRVDDTIFQAITIRFNRCYSNREFHAFYRECHDRLKYTVPRYFIFPKCYILIANIIYHSLIENLSRNVSYSNRNFKSKSRVIDDQDGSGETCCVPRFPILALISTNKKLR